MLLQKVGLQVYSMRDVLQDDFRKKIETIAQMGYAGVEFAGYGGLKPAEMAQLLKDNGLECYGTHFGTLPKTDAELEAAHITPEMAAKATFLKGKGCVSCNKSGYRGRQAIFELMMMSSKIRELTFRNASTSDIRRAARGEGMHVLFEDGITKVLKGITTIEEVLRVARLEEE